MECASFLQRLLAAVIHIDLAFFLPLPLLSPLFLGSLTLLLLLFLLFPLLFASGFDGGVWGLRDADLIWLGGSLLEHLVE